MTAPRQRPGAPALLAGARRGDTLALARAITAIENQTLVGTELALALRDLAPSCPTMGVTGPPGAGKSSLVSVLVEALLPTHQRIGVLTVDPSSPISGGAVLGDRVRMAAHSANPAIFIRSLATRGHLGGVTRTTRAVIDLLAASGMDLVIVETVGTGQSEVEVARLTDLKIAVCAPGLGDEMQAIKAGVLEVADLLVVNKADLPDADRTLAYLRAMLHHSGPEDRRAACKVSAMTRDGLPELIAVISARLAEPSARAATEHRAVPSPRAALAADAADWAAASVRETRDAAIERILADMAKGTLSQRDGVMAALRAALSDELAAKHYLGR